MSFGISSTKPEDTPEDAPDDSIDAASSEESEVRGRDSSGYRQRVGPKILRILGEIPRNEDQPRVLRRIRRFLLY
jgi:hypothetical protein